MATDDPNYPHLSTNAPPPAYDADIESAPPLYDEVAADAPPGYNPNAPPMYDASAPNAPPVEAAPPAAYNPAMMGAQPQVYQAVPQQPQPQPQVVYQQPAQQGVPQQAQPQNVVYVNSNHNLNKLSMSIQFGQPIPAPQAQPAVVQQPQPQQVVYVNQFGQPVPAPQGQQQVAYQQAAPAAQIQMQPMGAHQNVVIAQTTSKVVHPAGGGGVRPVVANHNQQQMAHDDPMCIYVFAVFGFLFFPVGLLGMLIYSCGQNLPPRQKQAFNMLVIATIIGAIIGIVYLST
eukprot:260547_1